MNLILAQTGFLPGKWEFLLYGIGGVLLLVVAVIVINFGIIYIRALFSGAKVTITELIALRLRRVPAGLIPFPYEHQEKSDEEALIEDLKTRRELPK